MQHELDIFDKFLRTKRLKHSKPRNDIVEVFLASKGHLTAQELHQHAKSENPSIGFATVYRTLKLLEACGLARSMDYGDGTLRYEPNRFQHHHVICTSCSRTVEFLSPELESLLRKVQASHHFVPQDQAVRILSVCTDCSQTSAEPRPHGHDIETVLSRDALLVAIANEQRGLHFYGRALEITAHGEAQEVFARLLDEERRHLAALQKEYEALCQEHPWLDDEPSLLYFDDARLEEIFPHSQPYTMPSVLPTSPAETLYIAMIAERRSYEFFSEYANKVDHPQGRAIFKKFAAEEQEHLVMIRHAYDALQDKAPETPSTQALS